MARIPHPFTCDECNTPKQPSNGWFLGFNMLVVAIPRKMETRTLVGNVDPAYKTTNATVTLIPWDEELTDAPGVVHLCGPGCVSKFVERQATKANTPAKAAHK